MLRIFVCTLAALPLAAGAQVRHDHPHHGSPAKVAEKPAPAAAPIAVPARAPGTSAFARYQRFTADEPLKDWRAVNDSVQNIGGWRVYAQEAARRIEAEKKAAGGKQ